uniref:Uncharacterized protein n=1 Tax=Arundo donax TaxID=35708 RepID=A0A0A9GQK7_ARUDO
MLIYWFAGSLESNTLCVVWSGRLVLILFLFIFFLKNDDVPFEVVLSILTVGM